MSENPEQTSLVGNDGGGIGCCRRFCAETSMGFAQPEDADGRMLDFERSFCYKSSAEQWQVVAKVILWLITVLTLVVGWTTEEHPGFYLAYLTHWSLTYALVYQTLSLLLSVLNTPPTRLLDVTWVFYSVAASDSSNYYHIEFLASYCPYLHFPHYCDHQDGSRWGYDCDVD